MFWQCSAKLFFFKAIFLWKSKNLCAFYSGSFSITTQRHWKRQLIDNEEWSYFRGGLCCWLTGLWHNRCCWLALVVAERKWRRTKGVRRGGREDFLLSEVEERGQGGWGKFPEIYCHRAGPLSFNNPVICLLWYTLSPHRERKPTWLLFTSSRGSDRRCRCMFSDQRQGQWI